MPFARVVDRGRGFHGGAEQGLPPPLSGQHGAPHGYGYIVKCTGCEKDASGKLTAVLCEYLPETKSGTPGADSVKVKGNLHWVSVAHGYTAEVRLYDRLFAVPAPGARREGDAPELERDYLDDINPNSKQLITAQLEPSLKEAKAEDCFQFERHG